MQRYKGVSGRTLTGFVLVGLLALPAEGAPIQVAAAVEPAATDTSVLRVGLDGPDAELSSRSVPAASEAPASGSTASSWILNATGPTPIAVAAGLAVSTPAPAVAGPAPVEPAPVESAPVESAPVESAPVESAPVELAPVELALIEAPRASPAVAPAAPPPVAAVPPVPAAPPLVPAPVPATPTAETAEVPVGDEVLSLTIVNPAAPAAASAIAPAPASPYQSVMNRLPFQPEAIGYTLSFHPGDPTFRGITFTGSRHIEIYVRSWMTEADIADVVAHEMGHAVDHMRNNENDRARWRAARGMAPTLGWWPGGMHSDLGSPAGDFAECFAEWAVGSPSFSHWGPCGGTTALMADLASG